MASEMGKRYSCAVCESQVLIVKAGEGDLECHDQPMETVEPKPLPSSD